ncbi:hypothetical protein D3C72_1587190 [compost metagenome]
MAADQAARDIHALLLAAGEGGRRQVPEAARQVQARQQHFCAGTGFFMAGAALLQRIGHHVQRRHARNRPQELADVADHVAAQLQHALLGGVGQLDPRLALGAGIAQADAAFGGQVVAVQAAQQRALAGARRARQHQAFAPGCVEIDGAQHRQADAALVVQRKHLAEAANLDQLLNILCLHRRQPCRMEETSSCV